MKVKFPLSMLYLVLFPLTMYAQKQSPAGTMAQENESVWAKKKPAWVLLTPVERGQAQDFSEDYKAYLNVARSALTSTREVIRRAHASGFTEFVKAEQVKPGARLIVPNRDRGIVLAVIGSEPIMDRSHVVGTHHDSPHIELKGRPILAAGGLIALSPSLGELIRPMGAQWTFRLACKRVILSS